MRLLPDEIRAMALTSENTVTSAKSRLAIFIL
jgi:hypothetical protein